MMFLARISNNSVEVSRVIEHPSMMRVQSRGYEKMIGFRRGGLLPSSNSLYSTASRLPYLK